MRWIRDPCGAADCNKRFPITHCNQKTDREVENRLCWLVLVLFVVYRHSLPTYSEYFDQSLRPSSLLDLLDSVSCFLFCDHIVRVMLLCTEVVYCWNYQSVKVWGGFPMADKGKLISVFQFSPACVRKSTTLFGYILRCIKVICGTKFESARE